MVDVSKLKKGKSRLGVPPSSDETATSLASPETAPLPSDLQTVIGKQTPIEKNYIRRDGRSSRKTNRTLAFATRVTIKFDNEIRDIAEREGLMLVEVLEECLKAYKEKKGY